MEAFQIIKPSPLLTPYVKQYWFLKTDHIKQPTQRIVPAGNLSLVFHRGGIYFLYLKGSNSPKHLYADKPEVIPTFNRAARLI